ncbi:MAG: DJ-1/PfpI family protein, partial [Oscillospiraceae bacterium]|nr:DJ-1/PfpI family protein [Oscillospiraceae bacterium]
TVVDLLRRAGIETDMVSVTGDKTVTSSHGVSVVMDKLLDEVKFNEIDMIVLPGGMPGTKNLEACAPLMVQVDNFYNSGKYVAAICATSSARVRISPRFSAAVVP